MTIPTNVFQPLPFYAETWRGKSLPFQDWRVQSTAAGEIDAPSSLCDQKWQATQVPGTVAQHVRTVGGDLTTIDERDWWYHGILRLSATAKLAEIQVGFEGLATLCDIWLNGKPIFSSQSMYQPVVLNPTLNVGENHWHLCFRSVSQELAKRRPRPSWKTQLVDQQQLRWLRTSFLGRIPNWTSPWPVIGPWRSLYAFEKPAIQLSDCHWTTDFRDNKGWLSVDVSIATDTSQPLSAFLQLDQQTFPILLSQKDSHWQGKLETSVANALPWQPHTHGSPHRQTAVLQIHAGDHSEQIPLGHIGFKSIQVNRQEGKVTFYSNGQPIFCRGACWTPIDPLGFSESPSQLRQALQQVRDAGLNMLRIGGTMVYESREFYELCDELGILVWQDFMFANLDYPTQDPEFSALALAEAEYQIRRLSRHVSLSAYCGGSEIQQQAAMLGLPKEAYANVFFDEQLPKLCAKIPYFVSSPSEGALPFSVDTGISHYYGVGAYRRPLADAELSQVKFASECLGFSHVPEPNLLERMFNGKSVVTHSPIWKEGIPRDAGSGYDFEDIRDHYLQTLYAVDPVALRAQDTGRYLELSRVITLEILAQTLGLWRSNFSVCSGALLWFWRDLKPGAGWGVIDYNGQPKSAYFGWKRASQTCAVFLLDRGLNGLAAEVINENAEPRNLRLELSGFNAQDAETFTYQHPIMIKAQQQLSLTIDELLGRFSDLTHSYKFGPSHHRLVQARLWDEDNHQLLSEDFYFPHREYLARSHHKGITIDIQPEPHNRYRITLNSSTFLQWVRLELPGFSLSNNYFHLAPNRPTEVMASAQASETSTQLKGYLEAINLQEAVRIRC